MDTSPACGSSSGGLTPHENKRLFRVARLARYLKQASLPLIAAKLQAIGWFLDTNKNHTRHNCCCFFIYLYHDSIIHQSLHICLPFNDINLASLKLRVSYFFAYIIASHILPSRSGWMKYRMNALTTTEFFCWYMYIETIPEI